MPVGKTADFCQQHYPHPQPPNDLLFAQFPAAGMPPRKKATTTSTDAPPDAAYTTGRETQVTNFGRGNDEGKRMQFRGYSVANARGTMKISNMWTYVKVKRQNHSVARGNVTVLKWGKPYDSDDSSLRVPSLSLFQPRSHLMTSSPACTSSNPSPPETSTPLSQRKFVELAVEAVELKNKMTVKENGAGQPRRARTNGWDGYAGPSTSVSAPIPIEPTRKRSVATLSMTSWVGTTAAQYCAALAKAVRELETSYKNRSEVRAIVKRTSVTMAYDDPLPGDAAEVAGQAARVALATELKQASCASQVIGVFSSPRQAVSPDCSMPHPASMDGNGAAAFTDMAKEFLDA
ncbi:hypothetical protein BU15DRAFT_59614 [Melanogaster broomeanus]|nr:hypothetical protein BU15DRAFT_59614 [Melanogaster broomeanus]